MVEWLNCCYEQQELTEKVSKQICMCIHLYAYTKRNHDETSSYKE